MPPSPPCWCVPISVLGRLPARPSALTPRWWIDYNMSMGPKNTYICKHHFFVNGIFYFMKLLGKLGMYLWTVACKTCSRFTVFWLQNIPGLKFLPVLFYAFFITSAEGGDAIDEENVAAFRFGKVVFADAADLKPNHEHPSLTLERALQHLLRLQCNDHQTETSRDKRKRGILRWKIIWKTEELGSPKKIKRQTLEIEKLAWEYMRF